MPGMFGWVGHGDRVFDELLARYRDTWGDVESTRVDGARVGGHAFRERPVIAGDPDGGTFAVDGELSIYRALERGVTPFTLDCGRLRVECGSRGNVARLDRSGTELQLATEPSGLFPLYYARRDDGLLFASHLRPLALSLGNVDIDPVGIAVYLHGAYFVGERTFFREVKRVLPGQSLTFDSEAGTIEIRDTSRIWAEDPLLPQVPTDDAEAAERAWKRVRAATGGAIEGTSRAGILLSAGWDSRTLLAACRSQDQPDLTSYSHGDPESRELQLATRVREAAGLGGRTLPLTEDLFELENLEGLFARSESLQFPYWARSGRAAATDGAAVAIAGIYGEVLGGHYGPTAHREGARLVGDVLSRLLPLGPLRRRLSSDPSRQGVQQHFRDELTTRPWCLDQELWRSHGALGNAISDTVGTEMARLAERGVSDGASLYEAFTTEHRGAQYIGAQMRSSRAYLDVAAPFADREALAYAARIPIGRKLHNRMNRLILNRHDPGLLAPPLSATLVSASAPLLVQEASRLVRKAREEARWRLHRATGGRIEPPRWGWINFEFLRETDVLRRIADELRSDVWDHGAIEARVRRIEDGAQEGPLHPLVHQYLKMLTVEWMIR